MVIYVQPINSELYFTFTLMMVSVRSNRLMETGINCRHYTANKS